MSVSLMRIAFLVTFIFCFGCITWPIFFFFKRPEVMPNQMRALGAVALVAFAAELWGILDDDFETAISLAEILVLGSLVMFWFSVFYAKDAKLGIAFGDLEPARLILSGPYRWIRHPFYSSYLLFWLGGAVGSARLILLPVPLAMGLFYWLAASGEERQLLNSRYGPAYAVYVRKTGRFFPRIVSE